MGAAGDDSGTGAAAATRGGSVRKGVTVPSGGGGTTTGSGTSSGRMPKLKPSGAGWRGKTTAVAGFIAVGAADRAGPAVA